jgi:hypothetical protein
MSTLTQKVRELVFVDRGLALVEQHIVPNGEIRARYRPLLLALLHHIGVSEMCSKHSYQGRARRPAYS